MKIQIEFEVTEEFRRVWKIVQETELDEKSDSSDLGTNFVGYFTRIHSMGKMKINGI
jgi:hypothetical protein